jgi:hypothetical protein
MNATESKAILKAASDELDAAMIQFEKDRRNKVRRELWIFTGKVILIYIAWVTLALALLPLVTGK